MLKKLYHKVWSMLDEVSPYSHQDEGESLFTNNLIYGDDIENNTYDVFLPETAETKAPTIFMIHGGGYISGTKEGVRNFCKQFADMGCVVFNFEYTKSDKKEKKYFPTPVYEFFEFYKHVTEHSNFSNLIDFNNIFLMGDSSGAHIATLIANIQTNDNLKFDYNLQGGPKIKGLILNCPSFGVYKFKGFFPSQQYHDVVFGDKSTRNPISEITHNLDLLTPNLPPILMLSVKKDPVVGVHKHLFLKQAKELNLSVEHYNICSGYQLFHSSLIKHSQMYPQTMEKIANFIINVCNNTPVDGVYKGKIYEYYKTINIKNPKS